MKSAIFIVFLIVCPCILTAQDPASILQQSYESCQAIQEGQIAVHERMKYLSNDDTVDIKYLLFFKRMEEDTLFEHLFHLMRYDSTAYRPSQLYTGQELVHLKWRDSTATVMSVARWNEFIGQESEAYTYYPPIAVNDWPFDITGEISWEMQLLADEVMNDTLCYHIQMNKTHENDTTALVKLLESEYHFWINKADYIPVRYTWTLEMELHPDTVTQHLDNALTYYRFEPLRDPAILTLASIPSWYTLQDYVPYEGPEPLPVDTVAPDWQLPTLSGDSIHLQDLQGELVLLDFFYKACYPCLLALPELQALHEEYTDKGLRIIGVNPVDAQEDDIAGFLSRRGITYPVVLEAEDVADQYRVSSYPTLYLIDQAGTIVHIQKGYRKGLEGHLKGIIEKYLADE